MDLTIITIAICALCVVIALWGWINFQLNSSAIFTDLKNANGTLNQTKDADPKTNGKIFDTLKVLCLRYAAGEIDAK